MSKAKGKIEKRGAAEIYLSRWPDGSDTKRTMRSALNRLAQLLCENGPDVRPRASTAETYPWEKLRYEDVVAIPAQLAEDGLGVRTINKTLSALRGVLEAAWRAGQMPSTAYQRIEIKNVSGDAEPAGRAFTAEDAAKLRETLGKVSVRDAALVAILRACGLRRIEVVRLKRESYDARTGSLRANGKRNKLRTIPVGAEWRPWIERHVTAVESGAYLFKSERGGKPLTRRGVTCVVEAFCETAGMAAYTPHDFRRSFATSLLEAGVDLKTVRDLMGHTSLDTTSIYDRRDDERKRRAVETIQ